MRGYKYQSLGPTDESGNNTGGRYLVTGRAEVDYLNWKTGAAHFSSTPVMQMTIFLRTWRSVPVQAGSLDIDSTPLPTLHANAAAKLSADSVEREQLQLTVPVHQTELRVSGPIDFDTDGTRFHLHADWSRVRWPMDGTAQLESPSGHLHVKGSLDDYLVDSRMTLTAPDYSGADLSLQVSELAIQTLDGHLQGTAMIAWHPRLETSIDLNGNSPDPGVIFTKWPGKLDVQLASRAEFSSAGIVAQQLKLNADTSLVFGQLAAQGNWAHQAWHFDLQEADLGHANFAPWTLDKSFRGQLSQHRLATDPSCWHSAGARLCLNVELTAATRDGKVELRDLPLDYFASLLPAGVEAQGTLELDGEIKQKEGQPANTRLRLDSHALALVLPEAGGRPDARIEVGNAWNL